MSEELKLKRGIKQMVADANREIENLSVEDAKALLGRDDVVFVDLRDPRELEREGMIPDPDSPYHKPVFASGKKFVLYCMSGWRSALSTKTVQDMGLPNVAHIAGGFSTWRKEGGEVAPGPKA